MPTRDFGPITGSYSASFSWGTPITSHERTYSRGNEMLLISTDANPGGLNAFHMRRTRFDGALASGTWELDFVVHTFSSYPCSLYDNFGYSRAPILEDSGVYATRFLSATNPTRADIALPVFLLELRDLPKMIEHAGQLLLGAIGKGKRPRFPLRRDQEYAAGFLAYQFGWAPMISDLKKMISFSDLTAKRQKEFDRLYSKQGLKRRMTMDHGSLPAGLSFSHPAQIGGISEATGVGQTDVWSTGTWRPVPSAANSPLRRATPEQVRRHVLGLSAANITSNIWNALPWTWLIDYFSTVGDFLQATQGRTEVIPDPVCVMQRRQTKVNSQSVSILKNPAKGEYAHISGGSYHLDSKERNIAFPSLSASVPTLSARQLSILGSLASLRAR